MKKHGWILEDNDGEGFTMANAVNCNFFTKDISKAGVFSTRNAARTAMVKLNSDVVRKVSLDKDGRAIKIIRGR